MSIINAVFVLAADVEFAVPVSNPMRKRVAIGMAYPVSTDPAAHLRNLYPVPVFILAPRSCAAAMAARLNAVFERVLTELFARLALAASAVGFHGMLLPISAAARVMARRIFDI